MPAAAVMALLTSLVGAPAAPAAGASVTLTTPRAVAAAPLPLHGLRVVLDPGHNGGNATHPRVVNRLVDAGGIQKACNTTGTQTNAGYAEHAFTYAVARLVATRLRGLGARVQLTRSSDRGVGPCIDRRAQIATAYHADAVVSIHADGAPGRVHGFHVIEPGLAPDKGNRRILAPSAQLATAVRRAMLTTGLTAASYPRGIISPGLARRSDLGGLNLARVPAVFVECGNMRNGKDSAMLSSTAGQRRIADAITAALRRYLSASKTSSKQSENGITS